MITALDATRPSLSGVSASAGHPTDAIAFFEAKQRHLPKAEWLKLQEAARKRAFTVAWTSSAQVLSDVKASLEKALAEGQSFQDWKKGLAAQLAGRWSTTDAHLETIFRNNIQAAYNAGRWRAARDPLTLKLRPFWKLTILLDDRTSAFCRPLARPPVILPADDPWWDSNYPPRHHRCRAVVVTLTRREAERQGPLSKAPSTAPQLGWGSTEGFADWQPDPAGYDPEIFKRARQVAPAAPPAPIAPAQPPLPADPPAPPGVFHPTVKARPVPGGGIEFIDKHGQVLAPNAITQRALQDLGSKVGAGGGLDISEVVRGGHVLLDAHEPWREALAKIGNKAGIDKHAVDVTVAWDDLHHLTYSSARLDDARVARFVAENTKKTPIVFKHEGRYFVRDPELLAAKHFQRTASGSNLVRLDVRLVDLDKLVQKNLRPADAWARDGAAAADRWLAGNTAAGGELRELVRERLAGYGMATRDDDAARHREIRFTNRTEMAMESVPQARFMPGANGVHTWDGKVILRKEDIGDSLPIAFRAVSNPQLLKAQSLQVQQDVLNVLRVLVHEEVHGASSIQSSAYSGAGIGMEEAATEILARKICRDLLGYGQSHGPLIPMALPGRGTQSGLYITPQFGGSYDKHIKALFQAVDTVIDKQNIHDRIEAALLKTRRYHREIWLSGAEQIDAFVKALGVTGTAAARLRAQLAQDLS